MRAQGHESRPHWFPDSPFEVIEIPHEQLEGAPRRAMWIRTRGRLPLDRVLHACVLTYLSDMGPLGAVRRALDAAPRQGHGASLDHSVWFHRQVRADQWLAFDVRAVAGGGARGLAIGTVHDESGAHAASLTQEVLVRPST